MIATQPRKTRTEQPSGTIHFPHATAHKHVLPNGLTVLVQEDRSAPVVSVQAWVATGSIHEGQWLGSGLSHLLEHMLFKGTERRSTNQIAQSVQDEGGYINAYTSFDRTVYWIDVPKAGTATAIDLLADACMNSTLPADELVKEQEVIRREFAMVHDDPDRVNSQQLFATAYRQSSLRAAGYRASRRLQPTHARRSRPLLQVALRAEQYHLRRRRRCAGRRGAGAIGCLFRRVSAPGTAADLPCRRNCRSSAGGRRTPVFRPNFPGSWRPGTSPPSRILMCPRSTCSRRCWARAAVPGSTGRSVKKRNSPTVCRRSPTCRRNRGSSASRPPPTPTSAPRQKRRPWKSSRTSSKMASRRRNWRKPSGSF